MPLLFPEKMYILLYEKMSIYLCRQKSTRIVTYYSIRYDPYT